jgi:homocysteine S-methyltransferase
VSGADSDALFVKAVELADAARCAFWEEHSARLAAGSGPGGGGACSAATAAAHGRVGSGHAAAADDESAPSVSARTQRTQQRHRPLVAYSCGAYGACMADGSEYSGAYADTMTEEQLMAFHKSRLDPVKGHPAIDVIAFETIPCLKEVRAIVRLLDTESYGVPAWVSVQCRDGTSTARGEDVAREVVPLLANCASVAALGFNCCAPERLSSLLTSAGGALAAAAAAGACDHPHPVLLCYPNSGEGWDTSLQCWTEAPGAPGLPGAGLQGVSGPGAFAAAAEGWVSAGARLVGGCCRTTPAHTAELRRRLLG